ncbi:MAG: hypothetical protein IJU20_04990 [Clostridia bacterium]|nr:hypothetical protein [Clostridia bacterium]
MNTAKKTVLSVVLAGLIVLAIAITIMVPATLTAHAAVSETLDYTNSTYPVVKVTNDEELRAALTDEGNKLVVIQNDIEVESPIDESWEDKHAEIPEIDVRGNKILHLNGHQVYYSDKSQLCYFGTIGGFGNKRVELDYKWYSDNESAYNKTLIKVGYDATLTITDNSDNKGVLQFDTMFSDIDGAPGNILRNVIRVAQGGKLVVHGGNIVAGRNKQVYSYVFDRSKSISRTRTVTAYTMGSAVIVDGGEVLVTGGTLKGRGHNDSDTEVAAIFYKKGKLRIENGKFFGYGSAPALCVKVSDAKVPVEENLSLADIVIKTGYFESYCETYASYYFSSNFRMGEPEYGAFVCHSGKDTVQNMGDAYANLLENQDSAVVKRTTDHSGDGSDAGDWGKECYTISQKDKKLNKTLLNEKGTGTVADIYQHQALKVQLDYWDQAYWPYHSQFNCTDLMQTYNGVVADGNKNAEYIKDNGITATFIVSKKVGGDDYAYFKTIVRQAGMNEPFPLEFTLKAGTEKWDVGEYQVQCRLTERSEGKSITNKCNTLTVTVVESASMLQFVDVQPQTFAENLGNMNAVENAKVKLQFNVSSKIELDSGLTLAKNVMVKRPGSTQYENADYDSVTGIYSIPVNEIGYYSVVEFIQLKKGNNVLAQKSRECHFSGVDLTKTVTVVMSNYGTVHLSAQSGQTKTSFKPGEKVLIGVTPSESGFAVKDIVVRTKGGVPVQVVGNAFEMPNDDVTVAVTYGRAHKLIYKESTGGATYLTDVYFEDGTKLQEALFTKLGYVQTGWKIGNKTYALEASFNENANMTAFPVFEPVSYPQLKVNYHYQGKIYTESTEYNFEENPRYRLFNNLDVLRNYFGLGGTQVVSSYRTTQVYNSEIESYTYEAGRTFYPGQEIYPMAGEIDFEVVVEAVSQIRSVYITIPNKATLDFGTNNLDFGTNNCGFLASNTQIYSNPEKTQRFTELVLNPQKPVTYELYIYAEDGYLFADDLDVRFVYIVSNVPYTLFADATQIDKRMTALDYKSIKVDLTFYPSCGHEDSDHDWRLTDTPHWCKDNKALYTCADCGKEKYVQQEMPEDIGLEELHRIEYVSEHEGNCKEGEYSQNAHYVCSDCGQCFSKPYGGGYVEKEADDFIYLHKWTDLVPGTTEVFGVEIHVHYSYCIQCGEVDESSVGAHRDMDGDCMCDMCGYLIPCEHEFVYTEVVSTCHNQGSMIIKCKKCDYEDVIIYNFADHTLVYVEATESTCSTHGRAAHYKCVDCGTLFDVDVTDYIRELDRDGLRFLDLTAEDCEYRLTDELEALLEAENENNQLMEYDSLNGTYSWSWAIIKEKCSSYTTNEKLKKVVDAHFIYDAADAYKIEHQISQPGFLPYDNTKHMHTELRKETPVTVNTDGYSGDLYCTDCATLIEKGHVIAKHTHAYVGSEWSQDEMYHYQTCNVYDGCTEQLNKAEHTYGDWHYVTLADKVGQKWRECTVCGYVYVEDSVAQPEVKDGEKEYFVSEGLADLATEDGKDVRYIFDLAAENDAAITFDTGKVVITFDKAAVKEIAGQDVRLKVQIVTDNLAVYNISNAQMALMLSLGGVTFSEGKATVRIDAALSDEEIPGVKVYYVNGSEKTDMGAVYEEEMIAFETNHFSTYVVAYEFTAEPVEPETGTFQPGGSDAEPKPSKKGLSGGAVAGIVIAIVAVLAGAGTGVFFLLKKKGVIGGRKADEQKRDDETENKSDE